MSAELTSTVWSEIKRYINSVDRAEAAETMISVLIDNDVSAEEIRDAFKYDTEIKKALQSYLDDSDSEEDEDEDEYVEDEDEDY
jgi:hypothetical protein